MGHSASMKLPLAEIARQAADRSHLEPDPVLCLADGYRCTACGAERSLGLDGFWEWRAEHRSSACQRQPHATARTREGTRTGMEASEAHGRVQGAKDSKDG
jgi:hypothetical protein